MVATAWEDVSVFSVVVVIKGEPSITTLTVCHKTLGRSHVKAQRIREKHKETGIKKSAHATHERFFKLRVGLR